MFVYFELSRSLAIHTNIDITSVLLLPVTLPHHNLMSIFRIPCVLHAPFSFPLVQIFIDAKWWENVSKYLKNYELLVPDHDDFWEIFSWNETCNFIFFSSFLSLFSVVTKVSRRKFKVFSKWISFQFSVEDLNLERKFIDSGLKSWDFVVFKKEKSHKWAFLST